MGLTTADIKKKVTDFLEIARELNSSAMIYSTGDLKPNILKEIKNFFSQRKIHQIDASMQDTTQLDKIIKNSLQEGSVLIILLEKGMNPLVIKRIDSILSEGYMPFNTGSTWLKVEPVESWQIILWNNKDLLHENERELNPLFPYKLVVN